MLSITPNFLFTNSHCAPTVLMASAKCDPNITHTPITVAFPLTFMHIIPPRTMASKFTVKSELYLSVPTNTCVIYVTTGTNAFNICTNDNDKYTYTMFAHAKVIDENKPTGTHTLNHSLNVTFGSETDTVC